MTRMLHKNAFLIILAACCLFSLMILNLMTKKRIVENEIKHLKDQLYQVLPADKVNNNIIKTQQVIGNITYYQACFNQERTYLVAKITTNKGYNGTINLLVSFDNNSIYRVIPLFHQETPGIGDQIEPNNSNWLKQFELSIDAFSKQEIDLITGATITTKAVREIIVDQLINELKDNKPLLNCEVN